MLWLSICSRFYVNKAFNSSSWLSVSSQVGAISWYHSSPENLEEKKGDIYIQAMTELLISLTEGTARDGQLVSQ